MCSNICTVRVPPIHLCIEAGLSATNVNTLPAVITANALGLEIQTTPIIIP